MSPRSKESAQEWLRRARSNFVRASLTKPAEVYWEDLCFDAQQAAEKALKALYIFHGKRFPFTHDLGELIEQLEGFIPDIPESVHEASDLSDYAVVTRYPAWGKSVDEAEYKAALEKSRCVLSWVESRLAAG